MKYFTFVLYSLLFFVISGKYFLPIGYTTHSQQYSLGTKLKSNVSSSTRESIAARSAKNKRLLKQENTYNHLLKPVGSSIIDHVVLSDKNYSLISQRENQKKSQIFDSSNPSYTLTKDAVTSAGVFDGDILVRTLWSNEKRSAGTYDLSTVWDGKDDEGNLVADKKYTIKVVSNNVTYDWLRPIGNTSDSVSGPGVHHAGQLITSMVQVGSNMYLATGYDEGSDSHEKFAIGKPNTLTTTLKGPGSVFRYIASDGSKVYTAGQYDGTTTFVTAINVNGSNAETLTNFSAGTNLQAHQLTYSGFDVNTTRNFLTGLAVQQSGNYLYTTHNDIGEVRVFNKNTGATVRTISVYSPRDIAFQEDNTLWVSKYSPHTGSTTPGKLSGTPVGSFAFVNNPGLAFDGQQNTSFVTIGGPFTNVGLKFASRMIITKVRVLLEAGSSADLSIVGNNGFENTFFATTSLNGGSFAEFNVSNTNPFNEVRILNVNDNQMRVQEVEVYGYAYSGGPIITKHTINSDGTLSGPTLTLAGFADAIAIAVNASQNRIAVADRGIYHQVKIYSTNDGRLLQTIGKNENYSNPAVYNNKFYFNNTRIFREDDPGNTHAFLTYQTDNSLWIGDHGNMRCQHFDADGNYIDNIQQMGYSYSSQTDVNDPTRIFSDYLEFSYNYTTNNWAFVRNWSKNIPFPTMGEAERMRSVTTLSNGRTYAMYYDAHSSSGREIIELISSSGIRHTGVHAETYNCQLEVDGSITKMSSGDIGEPLTYQTKPLMGFDGNNNLVWGSYVTIGTLSAIVNGDPVSGGGLLTRGSRFSNGTIATYSSDNGKNDRSTGYHFGILKNGQWAARTSHATRQDYTGDFPTDGAFDIGNGINYAGSFMQVIDRHAFWGYKGENWKQDQTNMYNHYLDNGLMVGQFGTTGNVAKLIEEAPRKMAGNTSSGTFVKVGNDIHFYHCDENVHGGVHHWKISNLGSIQEFSSSITKSGSMTYAAPGIDLMAGLPVSGKINSGTGRWTYSPATFLNSDGTRWTVEAGHTTYKSGERSIQFYSLPRVGGQSLEGFCNLAVSQGLTNNLGSWSIEGMLTYPEGSEPDQNYLEVLDNTGKIIVRISRPETGFSITSLKANSTVVTSGMTNTTIRAQFQSQKFIRIRRLGATILVKYGDNPEVSVPSLDGGANLSAPTSLYWRGLSSEARSHRIDLTNLKFYPAPAIVTGTGTGLTGNYFNNKDLNEPFMAVRTDSTVNFNWGLASPIPSQLKADNFSVRWSGQVQAPISGTYTFSTASDDGVRLWINNKLVINNWTYHATIDNTVPIILTSGQKYAIKLEYYDRGQAANIHLMWAYTGQARQVIPNQWLYPSSVKSSSGRIGSDAEETIGADIFNNLKAYPVPAHDYLWIKYNARETGDVSIQLVNVNAQFVFQVVHPVSQGENTIKIPVKGFAHGVYLLNLTQGYQRASQRVLLSD